MAHRISGVATRKVAAGVRKTQATARSSITPPAREAANSACSHGRGRCTSAPENRITRPWITTTISRVMVGISKASSAPPCCRAPNSSAASTMPSGMVAAHQGDGDAGEAVARREVEHDAMVHAHQLVDADEARQRRR